MKNVPLHLQYPFTSLKAALNLPAPANLPILVVVPDRIGDHVGDVAISNLDRVRRDTDALEAKSKRPVVQDQLVHLLVSPDLPVPDFFDVVLYDLAVLVQGGGIAGLILVVLSVH